MSKERLIPSRLAQEAIILTKILDASSDIPCVDTQAQTVTPVGKIATSEVLLESIQPERARKSL